jgi:hypothetical protein
VNPGGQDSGPFDGKELKRFGFLTQSPQQEGKNHTLGSGRARIGGGMCRVTTGRGASARRN